MMKKTYNLVQKLYLVVDVVQIEAQQRYAGEDVLSMSPFLQHVSSPALDLNPQVYRGRDHLVLGIGEEVPADHLWVRVDGGVQAHALSSPDHLCNLALVDGAELGILGVEDLT
jgi:hypothetical protein